MKYVFLFLSLLALGACNAMGFGRNDTTSVFNSSNDILTVNSDYGSTKIHPNSSNTVVAKKFANITSSNPNCSSRMIPGEVNGTAVFLDIFPGLIFAGIIPLLVDFIVGFDEMPEVYSYSC